MNEPTPPIVGQAARMTTSRVNDAEQTTLVCVVHLNVKPAYAECCAVGRDGVSRPIGRSPAGWRIDSVSAEAFADGTVRLWLSCWPEDASGTEAAVRWIDFPAAVHPLPPSTAVDQAARDLALQAGWQANQATRMAAAAQRTADGANIKVDALTVRVDAIDIRVGRLEESDA